MPYEQYIDKKFSSRTWDVINNANIIIEEFDDMGLSLTLRQLYYQFVARVLLPNTDASYGRLGSIVNDARLAGLIDWDAISDRTRFLRKQNVWVCPQHMLDDMVKWAEQYRMDMWDRQPARPEVWIEKDALVDVIARPCERLNVSYFSCRGYVSQSAMWKAACRLKKHEERGQATIVFHLGDHDPSGIDMTRDIQDRLRLFGSRVEVLRIGLSMQMVEEFHLPPNPAKVSDSRYAAYVKEYGRHSWELDALDPRDIIKFVEGAVKLITVGSTWEESYIQEERERAEMVEAMEGVEL